MATKSTKVQGLSKAGIDKLEKIMLANKKYYNQDAPVVGLGDCGTELCAACNSFEALVEALQRAEAALWFMAATGSADAVAIHAECRAALDLARK